MILIKTEEIENNGIPYIKKTYDNGCVILELNTEEPENDKPLEDDVKNEYISKSELDAAYSEGVNSIG